MLRTEYAAGVKTAAAIDVVLAALYVFVCAGLLTSTQDRPFSAISFSLQLRGTIAGHNCGD